MDAANTPRPEAVLFDIGNVLIEWQPERAYAAMVGADRAQAMFAAVDLHQMNELVDRGADFRETVYAAAEQVPEFGDEIRMWHDRWLDVAGPEIPRSVRLLRALRRKGVAVFALLRRRRKVKSSLARRRGSRAAARRSRRGTRRISRCPRARSSRRWA